MSRSRQVFAALLVFFGIIPTRVAAEAAREAAAKGPAVARPGYVLEGGASTPTLGILPGGLKVYVYSKSAHKADYYKDAKLAVAAQRKYGVKISFGGYRNTTVESTGTITIFESTAGCNGEAAKGGSKVADTTSLTLPVGDPQNHAILTASQIHICPSFGKKAKARDKLSVIFHELGHAVGLDHVPYKYGGKVQVMNPYYSSAPTTYQRGDIAGLKVIAAGTKRALSLLRPTGSVTLSGLPGPNGSLGEPVQGADGKWTVRFKASGKINPLYLSLTHQKVTMGIYDVAVTAGHARLTGTKAYAIQPVNAQGTFSFTLALPSVDMSTAQTVPSKFLGLVATKAGAPPSTGALLAWVLAIAA